MYQKKDEKSKTNFCSTYENTGSFPQDLRTLKIWMRLSIKL